MSVDRCLSSQLLDTLHYWRSPLEGEAWTNEVVLAARPVFAMSWDKIIVTVLKQIPTSVVTACICVAAVVESVALSVLTLVCIPVDATYSHFFEKLFESSRFTICSSLYTTFLGIFHYNLPTHESFGRLFFERVMRYDFIRRQDKDFILLKKPDLEDRIPEILHNFYFQGRYFEKERCQEYVVAFFAKRPPYKGEAIGGDAYLRGVCCKQIMDGFIRGEWRRENPIGIFRESVALKIRELQNNLPLDEEELRLELEGLSLRELRSGGILVQREGNLFRIVKFILNTYFIDVEGARYELDHCLSFVNRNIQQVQELRNLLSNPELVTENANYLIIKKYILQLANPSEALSELEKGVPQLKQYLFDKLNSLPPHLRDFADRPS